MSAPVPYYDDGQVRLFLGDCLDVLAGIPDCSIDAVVTDPPYGLEGFDCILIEKDPASAELIKIRLSKPIQPDLFGGAA